MRTNKRTNNRKFFAIILAVVLAISVFPMTVFAATDTEIDVEMTRLKFKSGTFNLTKAAKQKLFGYDTLQGCCAYNGYGFFALQNRDKNKAKIVKVRLSNMKVLKVSSAKKLYHANSLTYNTRTKQLVVAHGYPDAKTISVISPKTFKTIQKVTLEMPAEVPGMTENAINEYNGINAIAYNKKRDVYVARGRKSNDFLILNPDFQPIECVIAQDKVKMTPQGLDSYGDYTLDCQSFKGKNHFNLIIVRNWRGEVVTRYNIPIGDGLEFEEAFHSGNDFYAGFYFSTIKWDKKEELYLPKRYNYVYSMDNVEKLAPEEPIIEEDTDYVDNTVTDDATENTVSTDNLELE